MIHHDPALHFSGIVGTVAEVVRYPVKSMRGESLASTELTRSGLAYDRLYAFESDAAPPGMLRVSGGERRELLRFTARHTGEGVFVTTPDGESLSVTDPLLPTRFPAFAATRLTEAQTPQTDCRPVSLIGVETIQSLGEKLGRVLDRRRFRANFYLAMAEPFAEDALVGKTIAIGPDARLRILERDPRCRFITIDPDTIEPMPELMTMLHRYHQTRAGVYASVDQPGRVQVGDPLRIV